MISDFKIQFLISYIKNTMLTFYILYYPYILFRLYSQLFDRDQPQALPFSFNALVDGDNVKKNILIVIQKRSTGNVSQGLDEIIV